MTLSAIRSPRGAGRSVPTATGDEVVLDDVYKSFGETVAVDGVSVHVPAGEVLVLLGPSGCGKTTTLRLLAGFERPDAGRVAAGGRVLADRATFVPPERRQMGVVFQSYALWPHMTVGDNVGFGPSLRARRRDVANEVHAALRRVHLDGLAARYPHELSGGQQQRVALARALVIRPQVLLLDEPLSNLDTQLREDMRVEVKRLQRELHQTMVYVTHDQAEALSLADRVAVMNHGRIEQLGAPEEIYARPRTRYVARALGPTNIVTGRVVGREHTQVDVESLGGVPIEACATSARTAPMPGIGDTVAVSVRPSAITLDPPGADTGAPGVVTDVLFLGESVQYVVDTPGDMSLRVHAAGAAQFAVGDPVAIRVRRSSAAVLDEQLASEGASS